MTARLSPKVVTILGTLLIFAVALVAWFGFVSPQRSKASHLATQIQSARAELATAQALARDTGKRERAKQLVVVRRAMPDEVQMSGILRELTGAAAAADVRLLTITPSAPVAATGYQSVPIAISLEGRYFALAKFLHLLRSKVIVRDSSKVRSSGRLYTVQKIEFSGGAESPVLQARVDAAAYVNGGIAPARPAPPTTTTADGELSASASATPEVSP